MLKFNQLGVANNPYQGNDARILCVCSAGVLRSPTIAQYLSSKGFNTRAVGISEEFALIPLTPQLYYWADVIVTVIPESHIRAIADKWQLPSKVRKGGMDSTDCPEYVALDIPDIYEYNSPELLSLLESMSLTDTILKTLGEGND